MKYNAVRRIQFCSGHRVHEHESKCATLHGHNYVAFFHAEANDGLDNLGRVIDFSVLKERIGDWIDEHWDHTTILYAQDTRTIELVEQCESKKPVFILPTNPTAENMGEYLLTTVCPEVLENTGVIVTRVVLWETENCFAEISLE